MNAASGDRAGLAVPITRRAALGAATALLLSRPASATAAQSHAERTARALTDLIMRERAAALAYARAGHQLIAGHDEQHVAALLPHLQSVGHRPPPPMDVSQLHGLAADVAEGRGAAAVALERQLIRAYSGALAELYDPATRRTATTIMASHGQHVVWLSRDKFASLV